MIKALINLVEIYIIVKLIYKTLRFLMTGKRKGYRPSILLKIRKLIASKIHYKLDDMIKAQKQHRKEQTSDKVVNIKKYRSKFS